MIKNKPANAGDTGDMRLIPWSERSPGVGNGSLLCVLAWKIQLTEDPGGLQFMGS